VTNAETLETLAGLALFADLDGPGLLAVAHTLKEQSFAPGQRVIRQGISGSSFSVILDGEVSVRVDDAEVARLGRGEFFGEMSLLLGEVPVADVVAITPLRVLQLVGPDLRAFLVDHPSIMYRMLQALSRRLERADRRHG
jgi:CRP-like cAMP-binding protein